MYTLPKLKFSYDGLEGFLSSKTVETHYLKHHQSYLDKLNQAIAEDSELNKLTIEELIKKVRYLPETIKTSITNNGGGYYNHNLYWSYLTDNPKLQQPTGKLAMAINDKYGSFAAFKSQFTEDSTTLFGSGWVWLTASLEIVKTNLQDNPIMDGKGAPVLGIDIWEHAYYIDYQNRRSEYIENWWKFVDWSQISDDYKA